jgi:hypothetical protein
LRETVPLQVLAVANAAAQAHRRFTYAAAQSMPLPMMRDLTGPLQLYREPIGTPIFDLIMQRRARYEEAERSRQVPYGGPLPLQQQSRHRRHPNERRYPDAGGRRGPR